MCMTDKGLHEKKTHHHTFILVHVLILESSERFSIRDLENNSSRYPDFLTSKVKFVVTILEWHLSWHRTVTDDNDGKKKTQQNKGCCQLMK